MMLSNKPYLIRAFYDWIADSGCTSYLVANATFSRCKVPQQFVANGEIILNISPNAVRDINIGKDTIEFRASFTGVVHIISVPIKAVLAIYPQENQEDGMFFDYEEEGDVGVVTPSQTAQPVVAAHSSNKQGSHLKLVE